MYDRKPERREPIAIAAALVRRSDKKSIAGANCIMDLLKRLEEKEAELKAFRETAALKAEWARQALENKPIRDTPRPCVNNERD